MIIREPDNFYAALEGWEPILSKEGKVMGYRTKPLVESMIQVLHGSPELVHQGPQPEAHKLENYPEDWDVVVWGSTGERTTEVNPVSAPFVATVKVNGKTSVVLE